MNPYKQADWWVLKYIGQFSPILLNYGIKTYWSMFYNSKKHILSVIFYIIQENWLGTLLFTWYNHSILLSVFKILKKFFFVCCTKANGLLYYAAVLTTERYWFLSFVGLLFTVRCFKYLLNWKLILLHAAQPIIMQWQLIL